MREPLIEKTWALVTGASSGIGREYARALAHRGCRLLLVSNQPDELLRTAEELKTTYGVRAVTIATDLARADAAQFLYDYCQREEIRVSILINNAGIFSFNDLSHTPLNRIETLLNLHVLTVTHLCRLFGADMAAAGSGYILNMSSLSAWMSVPGIALYNASKAYIRNFSRSLHDELHARGVAVTVVCPGGVATDLYRLNRRYQRLGVRLGILMPPEKVAEKGLQALFHGRRQSIPGRINRLFRPLFPLIPAGLIRQIKQRLEPYEQ